MAEELVIATPRLELIAATPTLLKAELDGRRVLETALGASVPAEWPPELFDRDAMEFMLRRLEAPEGEPGWWLWYVVRHSADGTARTAVGVCGYKGAPDAEGTVEIGYSILREYQRQGYATEAVAGLLARAFADARVRRVTAETLPDLTASIGVLEKQGFGEAGPGSEHGVVRYELPRERYEARSPAVG
jgi:RimJ/RimL family protein N-acetyltransferase